MTEGSYPFVLKALVDFTSEKKLLPAPISSFVPLQGGNSRRKNIFKEAKLG